MTDHIPSWRVLLIAIAGCMMACGGDPDGSSRRGASPGADRGAGAAARPSAAGGGMVHPLSDAMPSAPAAGDSAAIAASDDLPCTMVGLWRPCSVLRRLESAGLGPVPLDGAVRQPGLAVEGTAFRLGRGELQVFLYADSASAIAEAGRVASRDAEPARARGIRRPPAVIRSANLVALLFNNNDRQLERVQLALTAGLPAA